MKKIGLDSPPTTKTGILYVEATHEKTGQELTFIQPVNVIQSTVNDSLKGNGVPYNREKYRANYDNIFGQKN